VAAITYGSYTVVSLEPSGCSGAAVPTDVRQDLGGYASCSGGLRAAGARPYATTSCRASPATTSTRTWTPGAPCLGGRDVLADEFSRLALQYGVDVPTWRDDVIHAAFLAAELVTGAHGAHTF